MGCSESREGKREENNELIYWTRVEDKGQYLNVPLDTINAKRFPSEIDKRYGGASAYITHAKREVRSGACLETKRKYKSNILRTSQ